MAVAVAASTPAIKGSVLAPGIDEKGSILLTGADVRSVSRTNALTSPTAGLAPTHLQANLIVLPSRYADDFRRLCARNPVPCPLIAESTSVGRWDSVKSHITAIQGDKVVNGCDIRRDVPRYIVYKDSKVDKAGCLDIVEEWTDDHVAFLIGCSFSFETALMNANLVPRHIVMNRNIPMYRTKIPLCPSGVFQNGTYVVSMRQYRAADVEKIREITKAYSATHGDPIGWGWDSVKRLGIENIDVPQWGEPPLQLNGQPLGHIAGSEDEVPIFWGCGVTPQEAVMRAGLEGIVMAHAPGHMLVLDCRDSDLLRGENT
ncbi:DUF1445-domain-containing protein [Rhizodiscina lignyota]|uniref:DUF1445-domain-containing protein n=1 Tax=Rhizodiscina lignyota TaxID=1504668 RepID=A0A9P4IDC3_9PEZI|nr:DUF1445-domain-containing protein [Rhizodiscina lignyota]